MDVIEPLSVLERLVSLRQVPGSRWAFWHDPNSQLGRMDADIEMHVQTTCFNPTLIYFLTLGLSSVFNIRSVSVDGLLT